MERIYENATDTAKKIRKSLKAEFPGVKFSVRSSTFSMGSSVDVHWTDGPMESQVDDVINAFQSSSFDGMQDLSTTHGYMYEGKLYVGAKYVSGSRELSAEYRQQLKDTAAELYPEFDENDYDAWRKMKEAEKHLLGLVEYYPAADIPETDEEPAAADPLQPEPVPVPDNVIPFNRFAEKRAANMRDGMTAEQRLKLAVLTQIIDKEEIATVMSTTGTTIDDLFVIAAQKIYAHK